MDKWMFVQICCVVVAAVIIGVLAGQSIVLASIIMVVGVGLAIYDKVMRLWCDDVKNMFFNR